MIEIYFIEVGCTGLEPVTLGLKGLYSTIELSNMFDMKINLMTSTALFISEQRLCNSRFCSDILSSLNGLAGLPTA